MRRVWTRSQGEWVGDSENGLETVRMKQRLGLETGEDGLETDNCFNILSGMITAVDMS